MRSHEKLPRLLERARPPAGRRSSSSLDHAAQRGRPVARLVAVDQQAAVAVADDGRSARRRQRRRPGCRWPGPRRRPARRTRCRTARRPGSPRRTTGPARPGRPAARTGPRRSRPSSAASWASDSGCSSPEPDGPPTTGTTRRERSSGPSSSTATARSSTSGAFSGWIRPANSSTCASAGQPERGPGLAPGPAGGRRRGRRRGGRPRPAPGSASYRLISCLASRSVLAISMSAASTTCSSPITRASGSGVSPVGEGVVLDLGHRVHRVHQRHAPAVAGQRADLAGEPVVGVDDVVVAQRLAGLGAQHLAGERAQLAGQLAPWSAPRTGRRGCGGPVTPAPASTIGGRAEEVARVKMSTSMPRRGQPPRQLDDVDVHAARVAGPRLVQRGGVQADHRDARHGAAFRRRHVVRHASTTPGNTQGLTIPRTAGAGAPCARPTSHQRHDPDGQREHGRQPRDAVLEVRVDLPVQQVDPQDARPRTPPTRAAGSGSRTGGTQTSASSPRAT